MAQRSEADAGGAQAPRRLQGLPPVVDARTVVLVLGSFPGDASLRAAQYYGHPRNHFWPIMQALWPAHPLPDAGHYAARCQWLLDRRVGLWDVYASCERQGSLDSAIRNPVVNDFRTCLVQCPSLSAIAHNGAESFRHAPQVRAQWGDLGRGDHVESIKLPSTSPAHAAWSFERKWAAWAAVMARHGLV